MATYLVDNAVPREQAKAAAYYAQTEEPPDEVVRVNAVFAELVASGRMTRDEAQSALIEAEWRKLVPTPENPDMAHVAEVCARLVAGGTMSYGEARTSLTEAVLMRAKKYDQVAAVDEATELLAAGLDVAEKRELTVVRTLDRAIAKAEHERDFAGPVPRLRDDTNANLAHLLGVEPGQAVSVDQFAQLLSGQRADGVDVEGKSKRQSTEKSNRVAFVDLTFSGDKSLSVAWALAQTEAERAVLHQAHKDAVDATMGYVADELGQMRRGNGGSKGNEQGHVTWIGVDHYTARPVAEFAGVDAQGKPYTERKAFGSSGDPQLHTHVLLLNTVLTDSGAVGSVDLDSLAGRIKEWGGLYQAYVATNLRRSGVVVALGKDGSAVLSAVPAHVRSWFSKRTEDGTAVARGYAKENGLDWDTLSPERKSALIDQNTQFRRKAKTDGGFDLRKWQSEAEGISYRHRSVLQPSREQSPMSRDDRLEHARDVSLGLVEAAFGRNAKLNAQELRVHATRGLVAAGVESARDIDAITRSFRERGIRQDGKDTALIWGDDVPVRGKARMGVTTTLHEYQERELVGLAKSANRDFTGATPIDRLNAAVARRGAMPVENGGLRFGSEHGQAQRAMMNRLATGGRFEVAIGVAGSGKTALLTPLVDAWKAEGRTVYGAALAWRQADGLLGAGIDKRNHMAFDTMLKRINRNAVKLDRNSVVVLDEIGLLGTRQLLDLLRLQKQHGFRVVAVGDPRQAQAIEAGPVIEILREGLGKKAVPELLSTIRQRTERERDIAGLFRDGKAKEALELKREDGTALLAAGPYSDAVARVAATWRARVEALKSDAAVTVSAPTNAEARDVAAAIRGQRRDMGTLGNNGVTIKATDQAGAEFDLPLAIGDRVRLFDRAHARFADNRHGLIGNNGSVLEVRGLNREGITLRTTSGKDGHVAWAALKDKSNGRTRLTYGDVLSIDAVQGMTSTEHILAMPSGTQGMHGFKAYVAASRHVEKSWIVIGDAAERNEVRTRRPLNDTRGITEDNVWENAARNLSRQPEKSSALAFLDRAHGLKRGSVRGLQVGSHQVGTAVKPPKSHRTLSMRVTADLKLKAFRERMVDAAWAMRQSVRKRMRI